MDHYERLRVSRDAPLEVIRAAYRALAAKHHPDRHGQSDGSQIDMALLNGAYEVLSDPMQRAQYDAELRLKSAVTGAESTLGSAGAESRHSRFAADASGAVAGDDPTTRGLADALSDIDWESLKTPPPVNPWLTRKRLLPLAAVASLLVVAGAGWWVNDLTQQMEAERAISAHLGQMAKEGRPVADGTEGESAQVAASAPASAIAALESAVPVHRADDPGAPSIPEPPHSAQVPAVTAGKHHMLDGAELTLRLDLNARWPSGAGTPKSP